jgi:PAS domain S-box-containing protein
MFLRINTCTGGRDNAGRHRWWRRPVRPGLRAKIIIVFTAALIVTSTINLFIIGRILKRDYESALHAELLVLADNLKAQLDRITSLGISTRDIEGFDHQCIELAKKNKHVAEAMVIDAAGTIIFDSDVSNHNGTLSHRNVLAAISAGKTEVYPVSDHGESMFYAVSPFGDSREHPEYAVVITSPARTINNKVFILMSKCNAVLLFTFGLAALLLLYALTTMLTSPLKAILAAMQDITASKDLEKRVDVRTCDEIGHIAEAFNTMTADLQQSTTSIDNLNREIQERKSAERKLELTQFSIDNCPDSVFRIEADGKFSYTNNAASEVFGYTGDEMLRLAVWDIDPNLPSEHWNELWLDLRRKGSASIESFHRTKGGRIFPVEVSLFYLDFHGRQCVYAFARDISERKRAEYEIEESHRRFKQIVDNAAEWIWEVDANGLYTYSSPVVEQVLGYTPHEIVGKKHFYDLFVPEQKEQMKTAAFHWFALKQPFRGFVNPNIHKNSDVIWLLSSGVPILDDDGNLVGYRGSDIDISDRKRAEEEIQKSRQVLLQIIDSMPFGVMVIGTDKIIRRANSTAQRLSGYSEDELVGKLCHETLCPADDDACPILDNDQQLDASERTLLTKDGRHVPILKSTVRVRLGDEEVLLEAFADILSLKEAEKARQEAMQKLEQANQNLKEFVYVASHDLREPLRKITAFGALLKSSLAGTLDRENAENLNYMIEGAERMSRMVEGLLAYSRVTTQKQPFETVDLGEVIEQIRSVELSVLIEEKAVTLNVPDTLPAVNADPVQMRQLLQNLIANGIKYQKQGTHPVITISARPADDGMLRVEVADNGIGIAPGDHQSLFVMFRRLQTARQYDGTGIGLAVCKKIVERHGGIIGVESELGKGSTFWFTVPAARTRAPVGS